MSNEAAFSPRGKWFFEESPPLISLFVGGEFVGEGMGANGLCLFSCGDRSVC